MRNCTIRAYVTQTRVDQRSEEPSIANDDVEFVYGAFESRVMKMGLLDQIDLQSISRYK